MTRLNVSPVRSSEVTVVVPNWNGRHHLDECLAGLDAQTFRDFEVVVVDNGSTDDSVDWLRQNRPAVRVVARRSNGGFAVAVNTGILAASGQYVALLNNDTSAEPMWLEALVEALEANPEFDVAASLMVLYDDPTRVNSAGDVFDLRHGAGANRGLWSKATEYKVSGRVLGASAGAALYRRSFFASVGLFDEDFFVAAEDTDINLRALLQGKRTIYVPRAVVRHKLMATRGGGFRNRRMEELEARNNAIVAAKDLPLEYLAWWLVYWWWRSLRSAFPLRPSNWHRVPECVSHTLDIVRAEAGGLRLGLRKRHEVWRSRTLPMKDVRHWLRVGFEES